MPKADRRRRRRAGPLVVAAGAAALLLACGAPSDRAPVEVVYAGSLAALFDGPLAKAFRSDAGRQLLGEPRGSVAGANLIRDGVRRPDAYVTADPASLAALGPFDPGWAVVFARGEMAIGYAAGSRFAAALDSARDGELPWTEPLLRPGFRLGRTDPELDPKGYRALIVLDLAAARSDPVTARALRALAADDGNVYPEAWLPARVEAGQVDAGVFYLAESVSHGLHAIRLPPSVNLGDPAFAVRYATGTARVGGREVRGGPIVYAATVPRNASRPGAGADLVAFLLGPRGRKLLSSSGFPTVARAVGDTALAPAVVRQALRAAARARAGGESAR